MKNSKAPSHLRPATRAWWTHVHTNWRLEEHHSRLLTMACEAWGSACQAREILAKDGILLGGRQGGARPHPAVAIERDARIAFARLVAQLNLDGEPSEIDPHRERGETQHKSGRMESIQWSNAAAAFHGSPLRSPTKQRRPSG